MIKKIVLAALVSAALGSIAVPASAAIYVQVAPPEPRTEYVPAPRRGYVWVGGHWGWRNQRHQWIKGSWIRERRGYQYTQPAWVEDNGRWRMQRGAWARGDRDGDGIPNRVDRDRDGDGVRNSADRRPNDPRRY